MSFLSCLLGKPDIGLIPFPRHSIEGLAARWVQWGAATNYDCNPIADETGSCADAEQPEDVWFLAGCFGGTVNRTCTIPANKKIFFPVFNIWMKVSVPGLFRVVATDLGAAITNSKLKVAMIATDPDNLEKASNYIDQFRLHNSPWKFKMLSSVNDAKEWFRT